MPRGPARASLPCTGRLDFLEGLQPVSDADGNIRYEVKASVFQRLCQRVPRPGAHVPLVIDEMNPESFRVSRGNISKVFGAEPVRPAFRFWAFW